MKTDMEIYKEQFIEDQESDIIINKSLYNYKI